MYSTRAVNRQPGYRPGRLVEPFAFNRNRDRNNDIHIQKHRKPQAHTHTSGGRRQQNNRNATANQQKLRQNQQQKTRTNPQKKRLQAEVIEKLEKTTKIERQRWINRERETNGNATNHKLAQQKTEGHRQNNHQTNANQHKKLKNLATNCKSNQK